MSLWKTPQVSYAGRILHGVELAHAEAQGWEDTRETRCGMWFPCCGSFYTATGWGEPWHKPTCTMPGGKPKWTKPTIRFKEAWRCPRCGERPHRSLKSQEIVCQACTMETRGCWYTGARSPRRKTGGWADVHEKNY